MAAHAKGKSEAKGNRFKVEAKTIGELALSHPHSPEDFAKSLGDYFEDMLADGWEFISATSHGNGPFWVFKAVGRT